MCTSRAPTSLRLPTSNLRSQIPVNNNLLAAQTRPYASINDFFDKKIAYSDFL